MVTSASRAPNGRRSTHESDLGLTPSRAFRRWSWDPSAGTIGAMSQPTNVREAVPTGPVGHGSTLRAAFARLRRPQFSLSLARRFLLATLPLLLVGGLAIGIWVGDQLERGIIDRTA